MWEAEWTAVLAGTPVDSRMGGRVLAEYGLEGRAFPMAEDPWRQTAFQLSTPAEKTAAVRSVLEGVREQGCRRVLVYCNSLSAAVEFEPLAEETGLRIVTPLQVYRDLAPRFRRLGLIAANAQGLAGIERTLYGTNPSLELLGACLLPVVLAIESGEAPEALVERHRLPELAAELSGNPLTDGLTLSGGEPFCQAAECAALARIARERGLNVWAYTGYTYERLLAGEVPDALALLEQVDVLVDGPFVEAEKSYAALFRGSANQRLIDVPKSLAAGAVVLWERPDPLAHFTRPES